MHTPAFLAQLLIGIPHPASVQARERELKTSAQEFPLQVKWL